MKYVEKLMKYGYLVLMTAVARMRSVSFPKKLLTHTVNVPQRHATVHKHKVKLGLIQIKISCQAQEVRIFIYCICILDVIQVLLLVNVEHRSNQTCTSLGGTQLQEIVPTVGFSLGDAV